MVEQEAVDNLRSLADQHEKAKRVFAIVEQLLSGATVSEINITDEDKSLLVQIYGDEVDDLFIAPSVQEISLEARLAETGAHIDVPEGRFAPEDLFEILGTRSHKFIAECEWNTQLNKWVPKGPVVVTQRIWEDNPSYPKHSAMAEMVGLDPDKCFGGIMSIDDPSGKATALDWFSSDSVGVRFRDEITAQHFADLWVLAETNGVIVMELHDADNDL